MIDHASNLRRTRADMLGTDDEEHYRHCHAAAKELERLLSENSVMREYIHECGLTDADIQFWVDAFPVSTRRKCSLCGLEYCDCAPEP